MYLKKSHSKKTGRTQLFIVEAYRDKDKKPRSKVIKTLGYLDVLEKEYDDPIAYFSELAKKMTAERNETMKHIRLSIDTKKSMSSGSAPKINLGFAALLKVYAELGLDRFFSSISNSSKIEYNLNTIFRFASCARLLFTEPSEQGLINARLIYDTNGLTISDYYRTADLMTRYKSDIIHWIYDHALAAGFTEAAPSYCFFSGYEYNLHQKATGTVANMLYPVSSATAWYSLFTDSCAFPVHYALFNSGISESRMRSSFVKQLLDTINTDHIIAAAGSLTSNFSKVIPDILKRNDGYILAFPLSQADDELKGYALDKDKAGFIPLSLNSFDISDLHHKIGAPFIDDLYNNDLLYNIRTVTKLYADNDSFSCTIEEKQILLYSPSFAAKCRSDREKLIILAEDIIAAPSEFDKSSIYMAGKYIKNLSYTKKSGLITAASDEGLSLNTELIDAEAQLDGYIVIATSEASKSFREICSPLVTLAFTDTYFSSSRLHDHKRPGPPATSDICQSDFFLSYIGLVLCRVIEKKIHGRFSAARIIESLRKCEYIHVEDDIYMLNYRDEVLDAIGDALDIDFSRRFMRLKDIKDLMM